MNGWKEKFFHSSIIRIRWNEKYTRSSPEWEIRLKVDKQFCSCNFFRPFVLRNLSDNNSKNLRCYLLLHLLDVLCIFMCILCMFVSLNFSWMRKSFADYLLDTFGEWYIWNSYEYPAWLRNYTVKEEKLYLAFLSC